jgi:hypothetical protein
MFWGSEGDYGYGWHQGMILGGVGYTVGEYAGGYPGAVQGEHLAQGGLGDREWMPQIEHGEEPGEVSTGEAAGTSGELPEVTEIVTGEIVAFIGEIPEEPQTGTAAGTEDPSGGIEALLEDLMSALAEVTDFDFNWLVGDVAGVAGDRVGPYWNEYLAANEGSPSDTALDASRYTNSNFQTEFEYPGEGGTTWRVTADEEGISTEGYLAELVFSPDHIEPRQPRNAPPRQPPFRDQLDKMYGGYELPEPAEPPSIFDADTYGTQSGTLPDATSTGATPPGTQPMPANAGYVPPSAGASPANAGYAPPKASYEPANASYAPPNASYSPPNASFSPPEASYPPPNASTMPTPGDGSSMGSGPPMPGSPTGSDMGQLDFPEPADGWTRARQVFSGVLEGVPQLLEGAAVTLVRGAAYIAPMVGPAIFLLDVYTQAQKHGGGAAGAFIAMNEMFNPVYGAMSAGIGAYDAHESGDDRKMGNQLFHLGVGVLGSAVLLEGGLKGAAKGREAPRGAGVPWKTIGERPSPRVVRQKYPNACGPAS